jgi:hypothetical protein
MTTCEIAVTIRAMWTIQVKLDGRYYITRFKFRSSQLLDLRILPEAMWCALKRWAATTSVRGAAGPACVAPNMLFEGRVGYVSATPSPAEFLLTQVSFLMFWCCSVGLTYLRRWWCGAVVSREGTCVCARSSSINNVGTPKLGPAPHHSWIFQTTRLRWSGTSRSSHT